MSWISSQSLAILAKIICYFYLVSSDRCLVISFYIFPHSFSHESSSSIVISTMMYHPSVFLFVFWSVHYLYCTLTLLSLAFVYLPSLGLFTLSLVSSVIIYVTSSFVKQRNLVVQCETCPYHSTLSLLNFSLVLQYL